MGRKKGFKHTEESKRKMRGRVISEETRKRMSGRICSPETRKKISESEKGKIVSEETREKFRKNATGKYPSKETRRKMSLVRMGKKNPNYGKIFSEEERRMMSIRRKGIKHSEETKRILREKNLGKKNAFYGKRHSEENKKKASERRAKQIFPRKDTIPELLARSILKKHEISFKKHHNFKLSGSYHQADILIEPNHVIEVFGDYWHYNPKKYDGESIVKVKRKERKVKEVWKYDNYVIDGMKKLGYKVFVVWESELKNELEKTTEKILKFVNS